MQPVAMIARPSFSWKKALLHGIAVIAVFMLLGMIFAATGAFGNQSEKIGEAAGRQLVLAFLLTIAASYGLQMEKKILSGVMLLLVAALFAYQIVLFSRVSRNVADDQPMTAAEQQRPVHEATGSRLCQPALGFSFPDPAGDFAAQDEPSTSGRDLPGNVSRWLWASAGSGERVLVQAIKGMGRTEESFRTFTAGLKKGLQESGNALLTNDRVSWTGDRGEFTLSGRFPNGVHLQMRCISRGPAGDRAPLTVCLQTFTGAEDDLREVEAGLETAPCGS